MAIYALGDYTPRIHPDAYVHPDAVVIGHVEIGPEASIWPCAVLRGDQPAGIRIGARTSIQDGTVVHTTVQWPTVVGAESVVGHNAHLEGCLVESGCLIGSGSVLLNRVTVRSGGGVAAGALVPEGFEVPAGTMALGVPARLRHAGPDPDWLAYAVKTYVDSARRYRTDLRRLD